MNENKKYFFGNEISAEGVKHNRVDYRALANSFDAVLCNDVTKLFYSFVNNEYNEPELYNGCEYYEDEEGNKNYFDIYQYYIISAYGADILQTYTNEIVWYIESLNIYVWGVTHFGTPWSGVLTDIKIDEKGE